MNAHDSSIRLEKSVEGAVHVTQCHHTSFHIARSQQLRLHESHHIDCHVQVTAGTILEDCHHVTFHTAEGSTAADIKDFNWLRAGVPSPNFTVQPYHLDTAFSTGRYTTNISSAAPMVDGPAPQELSSQTEHPALLEEEFDEDEDDEL